MVGITASSDSTKISIYGHGVTIPQRFELSDGIWIEPHVLPLDLEITVEGCLSFSDYAAALQGADIASFAIEVEDATGGDQLAIKAWNSLWLFHLISVACRSACLILYSKSDGVKPIYTAVSRNPFVQPLPNIHHITIDQLSWARNHIASFDALVNVNEFSSAMRCFGNSHYLFDMDVRIMLLWAGIEGLLSVDAELSRRLALYSTIIMNGSPSEKIAYYENVKRAYLIRSQVVHGSKLKPAKLVDGCQLASHILVGLLARCVELGRVPSPNELDRLAFEANIS